MSTAAQAAPRRDHAHPSTTTAARDTDLDDFRAFALIWVLLLHCLYWFGLIAPEWNTWKSWTLCEMPVLFFIAGASNSLGRARSWRSFYTSRLSRVLFPYWVYAATALAYAAWYTGKSPTHPFDIHWLIPTEKPVMNVAPLNWHLWFVPVYLAVMGLFPILRATFERLPTRLRSLPLWGLAMALIACDRNHTGDVFGRYLLTYGFWAYLGLYYREWKQNPWPRAAIAGVSVAAYVVIWRLLSRGAYQPDFQWSKFPPNFIFLLLGLGHFSVLTLAAPVFRRFARRSWVRVVTAPYKSYGYTIYLFHTLVFALAMLGFERWPFSRAWAERHPTAALALLFSGMVLLVPLFSWPFSFAERFPMRAPVPAPARDEALQRSFRFFQY